MRQTVLLPGVSFYNILKKMSNLAALVSIKQNCRERKLISLRSGFAAATPSSMLGCFHLLLQWLHFRAVCEPQQSTPSASELLYLGFCLRNTGSILIPERASYKARGKILFPKLRLPFIVTPFSISLQNHHVVQRCQLPGIICYIRNSAGFLSSGRGHHTGLV